MARYLVTLSLGPVQSLIGAARRTRDLWSGSWLLSEAARAAARVFHERQPGSLVFPCPEQPEETLQPQHQPGDANIANVLRAEVELADDAAARVLCREVRTAAERRVTDIGQSVRDDMRRRDCRLRDDVWEAQIGHVLDGFAAWAHVAGPDGYAEASRRLGGALAARKATRDFQPCAPVHGSLPKSSLDGALETVLPRGAGGDRLSRHLRLTAGFAGGAGEQLDALGVIKRAALAGQADQFTAWPRIAADTWIERLTDDQCGRLSAAYEPLVDMELATRSRGNRGAYERLPFDGHLLYAFRLENELARVQGEGENGERPSAHVAALRSLRGCLRNIRHEGAVSGEPAGEPVPYAAVLKADGDRMGQLLSRAESGAQSREISRALHGFAMRVPATVREHRGHAIYAGGDDVLAMVPLAKAVDCSRALADDFAAALAPIASDMGLVDDEPPPCPSAWGSATSSSP